jgi:hypothetical protein
MPARMSGGIRFVIKQTAATLLTIPEDCRYRCIWRKGAKKLRAIKRYI